MSGAWNSRSSEMARMINDSKPLADMLQKAIERQTKVGIALSLVNRATSMGKEFGLDRDYFFQVLQLIQSHRPADVFFGDIMMGPNGELKIEGYAEQQKSPTLMTQALVDSPQVARAELTRLPAQVRDPSGAARGVYGFEITAEIKNKYSRIIPSPTPVGWRGGGNWGTIRGRPTPGPAPGPTPASGGPGRRGPISEDDRS